MMSKCDETDRQRKAELTAQREMLIIEDKKEKQQLRLHKRLHSRRHLCKGPLLSKSYDVICK